MAGWSAFPYYVLKFVWSFDIFFFHGLGIKFYNSFIYGFEVGRIPIDLVFMANQIIPSH